MAGAAAAQEPGVAGPVARLEAVVSRQRAADDDAVASQQRIDRLDDRAREMAAQYGRALSEAEAYSAYAEELSKQVASQESEMASIHQQLDGMDDTARAVLPLMQKMISTLDEFVRLDLPFLPEERAKRVRTLEETLDRADVSLSEKYRRILEAYQIEMEYGRTVDTYVGDIERDGAKTSVEFVRVGRVSLLYHTMDGSQTGYWDARAKGWVVDEGYARDVREALRVAKQKGAPELMLVPVALDPVVLAEGSGK